MEGIIFNMFIRLSLFTGLVSTGLLLFIMTTYEPSSVGAPGILAVFFLGYLVILCTLSIFIWMLVYFIGRFRSEIKIFERIQQLSIREIYYYSSVLALAPIIIVSLRSVGEVSFYEISLVVLFEILGCLYVAKRAK